MKAVCLLAPRTVALVEIEEPVCAPNEVVVQMRAVGLCGSDLAVYDGHRTVPEVPWVLGHEGGGVIVEIGRDVSTRTVGDVVVVEPNIPCLACASCAVGRTSLCPHRRVLGMNVAGVLAERIAVPASMSWGVPEGSTPQLLATLEPLAVAVAAIRRSTVEPGATALVVGAGGLGLQTCIALGAIGAVPAVLDVNEERLMLAEGLGYRRALAREAFSYVFETAGVPAAVRSAVQRTSPGGTLTLMGLSHEPTELWMSEVVRGGLTLVGSIIYDHPLDFQEAIDLVDRCGLDDPVRGVGDGLEPGQAAMAFELARRQPTKTWVDLAAWHSQTAALGR